MFDATGRICSVYSNRETAQAKIDKYNSDPFIEQGTNDSGAPYHIETWSVDACDDTKFETIYEYRFKK